MKIIPVPKLAVSITLNVITPALVFPGKIFALLLVAALFVPRISFALGQEKYVETIPRRGSFPLVQGKVAATIFVDAADFSGVVRAADDLQADVARVTRLSPGISRDEKKLGKNVVLVGTIGKSPLHGPADSGKEN